MESSRLRWDRISSLSRDTIPFRQDSIHFLCVSPRWRAFAVAKILWDLNVSLCLPTRNVHPRDLRLACHKDVG